MSSLSSQDARSLGTIESEILQASDELEKAEKAIEAAQKQHKKLLHQLSDLQGELDTAVAELRGKCRTWSCDKGLSSRARETLDLEENLVLITSDDDVKPDRAELVLPHRAKEVSKEFDKLRFEIAAGTAQGKAIRTGG